jgi:hypothetical protein
MRRVAFVAVVFAVIFSLAVALLLPQLQKLLSPSRAQATASTPGNVHVWVGVGTLDSTVPFNTDAFFDSSDLLVNNTIYFRLTKPDSSTVDFQQNTDQEGRIRGQIFNSIIDQTGSYTLAITGPPAIAGVSHSFTVNDWQVAP